jgi:hypothetical protein
MKKKEKRKLSLHLLFEKKNKSFSRVKVIVYPICPFYISLLQTI